MICGTIIQRLKSKEDMETWWRHRDSSLHYSLKSIKKELRIPHVIEDAAVPLDKMPKIFSKLKKLKENTMLKQ